MESHIAGGRGRIHAERKAVNAFFVDIEDTVDSRTGRHRDAAVRQSPAFWMNLGAMEERLGRLATAAQCYGRAAGLSPHDEKPLLAQWSVQKHMDDVDGALESLDRLIGINPMVRYVLVKADTLLQNDRADEAEALLLAHMDLGSKILTKWFSLLDKQRRHKDIAKYLASVPHASQSATVQSYLGLANFHLGRFESATHAYLRAHALEPENPGHMAGYAEASGRIGQLDIAKTWFERALDLDPVNPRFLFSFGSYHRYRSGEAAFERVKAAALHLDKFSNEEQCSLHYALGKAFDDVGELDSAFVHFEAAGKKRSLMGGGSYFETTKDGIARLAGRLRPESIVRGQLEGHPSSKPIFVLGMPRSGSTLVEQILASHPKIGGIGEQNFLVPCLTGLAVDGVTLLHEEAGSIASYGVPGTLYERGAAYVEKIERASGGSCARVVDKMFLNSQVAGLIPLILPNAHIIHTRRHPVEICLSSYRIYFEHGFMNFTNDLAELGRAYRMYHDTIQLWKKVLPPGRILEVWYEDVVDDLEGETRRILDYVGMPADDTCLRFYESKRPVQTASFAQVRKPIYRDAVDSRWHKYKPYLGPLLDELGPLVDEFEAEWLSRRSEAGR